MIKYAGLKHSFDGDTIQDITQLFECKECKLETYSIEGFCPLCNKEMGVIND